MEFEVNYGPQKKFNRRVP